MAGFFFATNFIRGELIRGHVYDIGTPFRRIKLAHLAIPWPRYVDPKPSKIYTGEKFVNVIRTYDEKNSIESNFIIMYYSLSRCYSNSERKYHTNPETMRKNGTVGDTTYQRRRLTP